MESFKKEIQGNTEYLISGNTDKYSNAQEVIDDLVSSAHMMLEIFI